MNESLIYGKNREDAIVSIDVKDNKAVIYQQGSDGNVISTVVNNKFWTLLDKSADGAIPLLGSLNYNYIKNYDTEEEWKKDSSELKYKQKIDTFNIWSPKEAHMIRTGRTFYKGMEPKDVSVLSFDIETTSLEPGPNAKILLISNTFRDAKGNLERRLFCYDDYKSTKEMVYAWCHYVCEKDPSILVGHNIFGFDLPFLSYYVDGLPIGRADRSNAEFASRTSEFRKEGGQTYTYTNVLVVGRELVDTMHLAIKYDAASRKYDSYGLKSIIRTEGLERPNRQHYDASQIRVRYQDESEWKLIKQYAEDDADDALALFDLMIPSYFYFTQAVPKTLQQIINGASGSQVNAWMLRAYLQQMHSIPKASDRVDYEGAISFGHPGVYKDVCKVDVASLYPSIILQEQIYDKAKDPKQYFLQMVSHFTEQRLRNKSLSRETGYKKYKDLEQSQKIFINSAYGFLGASGLNFNSPRAAASVTRIGREILQKGMDWASVRGFSIINGDTDSFCYTGSKDFKEEVTSLNQEFPAQIKWEDDGQYPSMVIVKAKNYALKYQDGTVKIKGSGLKATMKEPALIKFNERVINNLLGGDYESIRTDYERLALSITSISRDNIREWVSKKTITKSVLSPGRTQESRILEALSGKEYSEGDKIYTFFEDDKTVRLLEDFTGKIDTKILFKKLYNTITVFESVVDLSLFPNYSLKRNECRIPRCPAILYSQTVNEERRI